MVSHMHRRVEYNKARRYIDTQNTQAKWTDFFTKYNKYMVDVEALSLKHVTYNRLLRVSSHKFL